MCNKVVQTKKDSRSQDKCINIHTEIGKDSWNTVWMNKQNPDNLNAELKSKAMKCVSNKGKNN